MNKHLYLCHLLVLSSPKLFRVCQTLFLKTGGLFAVNFMLKTQDTLCNFAVNHHYKYFCFQLGVNGYSFIINNNGHILYHPDLRPLVSHVFNFFFYLKKFEKEQTLTNIKGH